MRRTSLIVILCATLVLGACSSDGSDGGSEGASDGAGAAMSQAEVSKVLRQLADDVVIPAYVALDESLAGLLAATTDLCEAPSPEALAAAQDAWKASIEAWQHTRAGAVGPAMERRLMSAVAFTARPSLIDDLVASTDPVDPESLSEEGAAVRGLYAAEIALFGEGSESLTTAEGARRCEYATSVATLSSAAAAEVASDWTEGEARMQFVEGIDGGPQSTVAGVLNEVSRRLNEIDTIGLRDMVAAAGPEDLDEIRSDGPASYRLADRAATLEGISAIIGNGSTGLSALAGASSADLGERFVAARDDADAAMAELPDSVTAAFGDPDAVAAASEAVAALKVIASTEVASQLGVTITFSDSDGDA